MKYEKPQVEVVKFESEGFMTASTITYGSAADMLQDILGDYGGNTNNFKCPEFGGTPTIVNGKKQVTVNGFTFEWHGNDKKGHWKAV